MEQRYGRDSACGSVTADSTTVPISTGWSPNAAALSDGMRNGFLDKPWY